MLSTNLVLLVFYLDHWMVFRLQVVPFHRQWHAFPWPKLQDQEVCTVRNKMAETHFSGRIQLVFCNEDIRLSPSGSFVTDDFLIGQWLKIHNSKNSSGRIKPNDYPWNNGIGASDY